jgi:lipopolysaccharide/colanic/teichoic acid biosynthesis glycosyltransferase
MKRLFDIILSTILIIILLPLFIFVRILIKLETKGPVFFVQERLGKNQRIFTLYKFRSMRVNEDRKEQQVFIDHPDITRIGFFSRRFKIDELPQLFNVLKGDMSLVGPQSCFLSLVKEFDEHVCCSI